MRGRKKNHLEVRGSAENADRGAMAGGGRGSGGLGRHEVKEELMSTASRKRKRGQNSSESEFEEQIPLDEPNAEGDEISDENFPKLGMQIIFTTFVQ